MSKNRSKSRIESLVQPVEIRTEVSEGESRRIIRGSAVVYNQLSEELGGFREQFLPGSLSKTIRESNIKSVWNHNDQYVLGSLKTGTLRLVDTEESLDFEADLPDTSWADDLAVSINRGDIDQMSFRFRTIKDNWRREARGEIVRDIHEAQLVEISPVAFPAYPQTAVSLRGLLDIDAEEERIEQALIRAKAGALEEEDTGLLEMLVAALRSLVPEPAQPGHSEETEHEGAERDSQADDERVEPSAFSDRDRAIEEALMK